MTPRSVRSAEHKVFSIQTEVPNLSRLRDMLTVRRGLIACGADFTVTLITEEGRLRYTGGDRWGQEACTAWRHIRAVACGASYVLGLDSGGRVHHAGKDIRGMADEAATLFGVRLIACGETHAAAVLRDGRVCCIGDRRGGRCATEAWRRVADVCCGKSFTAGVTHDGDILLCGGNRRLRRRTRTWHGIIGVFADACGQEVYGLTAEGRLVSTARLPASMRSQSNLVQVAVSGRGLWAVTAGGDLLSRYPMPTEPMGGAPLSDVVAVAAGPCHAVTVDYAGVPELLGKAVRRGRVLTEVPAGRLELGRSDMSGAACLFRDFASYCREAERKAAETAQTEKRRLDAARRAASLGGIVCCGDRITAGVDLCGHGWLTGGSDACRQWRNVTRVSCGRAHVLGLREDGTVVSAGNIAGGCCEVKTWSGIVDIQAAAYHSLGLTADGHVCFAGLNDRGQGDVSGWSDIMLLRTSDTCTVGVDKAGRLHVAGACGLTNADLTSPVWHDLADLRLSEKLLVGLSRDGLVCALPLYPDEMLSVSLAPVKDWYGVTRIAVGRAHVAGLSGGIALAAGDSTYGQCHVDGAVDAVDVACTDNATLVLSENGTVRCAGSLPGGAPRGFASAETEPPAPATHRWTKVMALTAGHAHAVGLTQDGRVLSCGLDRDGQCTGTRGIVIHTENLPCGGHPRQEPIRMSAPHPQSDTAGTAADADAENAAERTRLLWSSYAPAMRREAAAWRDHLSDGGDILYILMPEGTYSYSYTENRMVGLDRGLFHHDRVGGVGSGALIVSPDGTLTVEGEVWQDLFCAESSDTHTVGLRTDGTVLCTGANDCGQCEVSSWTNIVQVLALDGETLGLCANGHILHTGRRDRILDTLRGVRAIAGWRDRQIFIMANGVLMLHAAGSEYPPTAIEGIRLFTPGVGHSILSRRGVYADCPAGARQFRRSVACGMRGSVHICPDGTVTFTEITRPDKSQDDIKDKKKEKKKPTNESEETEDSKDSKDSKEKKRTEIAFFGGWRGVTAVAASGNTVVAVSDRRLVVSGTDAAWVRCIDALNRSLFILHGDREDWHPGAPQPNSTSDAAGYAAVSLSAGHIAALRGDGRVFSEALTDMPRDTGHWRDVTDVSCGPHHTAAVTADGLCVAVGDNSHGQCDVGDPDWHDLVMVSCGEFHTVALRGDGRVVAVGSNSRGQCRVDDLCDVISIACLPETTVCIHADGHVTLRGAESVMTAAVPRFHEIIAADGDELKLACLTVGNKIHS